MNSNKFIKILITPTTKHQKPKKNYHMSQNELSILFYKAAQGGTQYGRINKARHTLLFGRD